jgi:hypothetical protein
VTAFVNRSTIVIALASRSIRAIALANRRESSRSLSRFEAFIAIAFANRGTIAITLASRGIRAIALANRLALQLLSATFRDLRDRLRESRQTRMEIAIEVTARR